MSWIECKTEADILIAYEHLKEIKLWTDKVPIVWINTWCLDDLDDWAGFIGRRTLKIFYTKDDKDNVIGSFIFKFVSDMGANGSWICMGTNFDDIPYQEADALIYPFWKNFIETNEQEIVFLDSWINGQLVAPERTDLIERMGSYGIKIDVFYRVPKLHENPIEIVRLI